MTNTTTAGSIGFLPSPLVTKNIDDAKVSGANLIRLIHRGADDIDASAIVHQMIKALQRFPFVQSISIDCSSSTENDDNGGNFTCWYTRTSFTYGELPETFLVDGVDVLADAEVFDGKDERLDETLSDLICYGADQWDSLAAMWGEEGEITLTRQQLDEIEAAPSINWDAARMMVARGEPYASAVQRTEAFAQDAVGGYLMVAISKEIAPLVASYLNRVGHDAVVKVLLQQVLAAAPSEPDQVDSLTLQAFISKAGSDVNGFANQPLVG